MNSGEKDRVWVFASTLFAVFLLFFSGFTIGLTNLREQSAAVQIPAEDAWPVGAEVVRAPRVADREFLATAYSDYGITKSGVVVATGIVAADPTVLPIGSIIEIEAGDYSGIYTVMDTGGDVKGEKIDIFIPNYDEAVRFGIRKVAVKVLRRGWHPQGGFATAG